MEFDGYMIGGLVRPAAPAFKIFIFYGLFNVYHRNRHKKGTKKEYPCQLFFITYYKIIVLSNIIKHLRNQIIYDKKRR